MAKKKSSSIVNQLRKSSESIMRKQAGKRAAKKATKSTLRKTLESQTSKQLTKKFKQATQRKKKK